MTKKEREERQAEVIEGMERLYRGHVLRALDTRGMDVRGNIFMSLQPFDPDEGPGPDVHVEEFRGRELHPEVAWETARTGGENRDPASRHVECVGVSDTWRTAFEQFVEESEYVGCEFDEARDDGYGNMGLLAHLVTRRMSARVLDDYEVEWEPVDASISHFGFDTGVAGVRESLEWVQEYGSASEGTAPVDPKAWGEYTGERRTSYFLVTGREMEECGPEDTAGVIVRVDYRLAKEE